MTTEPSLKVRSERQVASNIEKRRPHTYNIHNQNELFRILSDKTRSHNE